MTSNGIALLLGLSTAVVILWLVRRDHIHGVHAIGWLILAFAIAVFATVPSLSDQIANAVGVAYSPALMLSVSVMALFVKALATDIENAKLKTRHIRLIQRLAILEARLENLAFHKNAHDPEDVDADEAG